MDTSETYIKMCEKAEEIQAIWRDKEGDYYIAFWDSKARISHEDDEGAYKGLPPKSNIWLPRQDQLQEMIGFTHKEKRLHSFIRFVEWGYGSSVFAKQPEEIFESMEQLWLAFAMKEKYSKVWDGEDWVSKDVWSKAKD